MLKVTAPSNIALIKYMGKEADNIPANVSLSYSLDHLLTTLVLEGKEGADEWRSLEGDQQVQLNEHGKKRYMDFFTKLKLEFGIKGSFYVSSGNDFPSDCGLASSASSFAALSLASYRYSLKNNIESLKKLGFAGVENLDLKLLSSYSRQGSGSSCRSLYSEWAAWKDDHAFAVEFPYKNLLHLAVIAEEQKKTVSSSEAHKMVRTSLLMEGRTHRAELRYNKLNQALIDQDWRQCYELCWAEFWDMHALFETSEPSFGYMNGASIDILTTAKTFWQENEDGPLVTMDAGPNVHLLFRSDQTEAYQKLKDQYSKKFKVWGNL